MQEFEVELEFRKIFKITVPATDTEAAIERVKKIATEAGIGDHVVRAKVLCSDGLGRNYSYTPSGTFITSF